MAEESRIPKVQAVLASIRARVAAGATPEPPKESLTPEAPVPVDLPQVVTKEAVGAPVAVESTPAAKTRRRKVVAPDFGHTSPTLEDATSKAADNGADVPKKRGPKPFAVGPQRYGQSGRASGVTIDKLNAKERQVFDLLKTRQVPMTIAQMAGALWEDTPPKVSCSWVRNSLRRLVRAQHVAVPNRGQYEVQK